MAGGSGREAGGRLASPDCQLQRGQEGQLNLGVGQGPQV